MHKPLLLAGVLALGLSACSQKKSTDTATATPPASAATEAAAVAPAASSPAPDQVSELSGAAKDLNAQMTDMAMIINFDADALFDPDEADIKAEAVPNLEKLAQVVKQYAKSRVAIHGYTDAKGNDGYNLALSQRRAQAIADWLAQHQASAAGLIQVKGFGEANPVAPNTKPDGTDNPEGRQQNRRVEVIIS